MSIRIIIGLLWILGGILMFINKQVSFGAIQIKLDGTGLYLITSFIVIVGIIMIISKK